MHKRVLHRVLALLFSSLLGYVAAPGCTLKLGAGSGDNTDSSGDDTDNGTIGGSTDEPGEAAKTPE